MKKLLRALSGVTLAMALLLLPGSAVAGTSDPIKVDKAPNVSLVPQGGEKDGDGLSSACFAVYCDGVYSGWVVCGNDLGGIIDAAIGICS